MTGSRDWADKQIIAAAFDDIKSLARSELIVLVHGGCPSGADALCADEARNLGWVIEEHPANWLAHGKAAGFIRNQEMVDAGAVRCLAFVMSCKKSGCTKPKPHDSHGTADCIARAGKAGIMVWKYRK